VCDLFACRSFLRAPKLSCYSLLSTSGLGNASHRNEYSGLGGCLELNDDCQQVTWIDCLEVCLCAVSIATTRPVRMLLVLPPSAKHLSCFYRMWLIVGSTCGPRNLWHSPECNVCNGGAIAEFWCHIWFEFVCVCWLSSCWQLH